MATRPAAVPSSEQLQLARAQAGDRRAFDALVAPYRRGLHVHCYRMLGSLHDAEDLLQETLLRAWRALDRFEERSSIRGWLYRIATNACLDALKRRRRRQLPDSYAPADDPRVPPAAALDDVPWLEPYPDRLLDGDPARQYEEREAIELVFITAMQQLSPRQRAVLILRDVLGFSAREAAMMLETSVASVTSALQRARVAVKTHDRTIEAEPHESIVVSHYVRAWEAGDVEGLVALLREDARMTMPPTPSWYSGRDAIGVFLATFLASGPGVGSRLVPTRANRQPALAVYTRTPDTAFRPLAVKVLTIEGGQIAAITGFTDPTLFSFFDLVPERSFD